MRIAKKKNIFHLEYNIVYAQVTLEKQKKKKTTSKHHSHTYKEKCVINEIHGLGPGTDQSGIRRRKKSLQRKTKLKQLKQMLKRQNEKRKKMKKK